MIRLIISNSRFIVFSSFSFSQQGFLFVKKGIKKKRIYTEGDMIHMKLQMEAIAKE